MRRLLTRLARLARLATALSLVTTVAHAHDLGLSRGDYRLHGSTVRATLTFSAMELFLAVPELHDTAEHPSTASLVAARDAVQRTLVDRVVVVGDGVRCDGVTEHLTLSDETTVDLSVAFRCSDPPEELGIDFAALDVLATGHRHLARATLGSAKADWVAALGNRTRHLRVEHGERDARSGQYPSLVRLGIEHILTGYDHLLFLAGLVLALASLRSLLLAVTAFTLAHSATLALSVFGIVGPSPRLVEPAIALSIAYVGVENYLGYGLDRRWRLTLLFGLVHGFGFARALSDLRIPRSDLPLALLSFNVGVEAGQVLVLTAAVCLVRLASSRGAFDARVARALSGAVAVAGLVWFAARLVA